MWKALGKRFSLFGQNSNIHGFKFIVNEKENELSRIFWVVVLIVSGGCLYLLLLPVIQRSDKISFTPDTLYLNWTTAFPAITVCEAIRTTDAAKRFQKFYPDISLSYPDLVHYSKLLYGQAQYSPKLPSCGEKISCDISWRNVSQKVRRGHDELLADCVYNGQSFPCSKHFHVVDSKNGPCFSFNSLQNRFSKHESRYNYSFNALHRSWNFSIVKVDQHPKKTFPVFVQDPCFITSDNPIQNLLFVHMSIQGRIECDSVIFKKSAEGGLFVLNRTTGPDYLRFHLLFDAEISVHSNEELSTNALDPDLKLPVSTKERIKSKVELLVSTVAMENDLTLPTLNLQDRLCHFPWEVPRCFMHSYSIYSYGACKLARETERAFNHCSCVSPIRDLTYKEKYCNLTGWNCLLRYEVETNFLKHDTEEDDCLPSCVESELKILHKSLSEYDGWQHNESLRTLVTVRMASLPTLRYQRNMLRTNLDLVVTVGGLAGLFFGASILSLVETFYLICRKSY